MDTHPDRTDNLSALERRLSAWQPAAEGLDADTMLFAAGRASAHPRRARFLWPALTGLLCVLLAAQGVWLAVERSERLSLAQQLRGLAPTSVPSLVPPAVPARPVSGDAGAPESRRTSRPPLVKRVDAGTPQPEGGGSSAQVPANDPIYHILDGYHMLPENLLRAAPCE